MQSKTFSQSIVGNAAAISAHDVRIGDLETKVGDTVYSSTNYVTASTSATTAIGALDAQIKSVADQVSGGVSSDLTALSTRVGMGSTLNAYDGAAANLTATVNKLGSNVGDLDYTSTNFLNA